MNDVPSTSSRRTTARSTTRTTPYFSTQKSSIGSLKGNQSSISSPAKRKANKSPVSTATKNSSKKSKVVARTQSFQPAWWGNVKSNKESSSYPPVHTLILGTHPSIPSESPHANEMFGNQQNAFWYIAGDALGFRRNEAISSTTGKPFKSYYEHLRYSTDKILPYSQQVECMTSKGFALWDIITEFERKGSLDTDIKSEEANEIRELVEL